MTKSPTIPTTNGARDYAEIGAAFVIVAGILIAFRRLDLLPRTIGVSDTMGYGLVFIIGLVASVSSCIAVTGGLLVAVAAKYNEATSDLTPAQRMRPHIYFNAGRVLSYTVLGGAIGALGSALTLTPQVNGVLAIVASVVMILLGLQMLRLLPALTRFIPTMPKAFAHYIHDLAERDANGGAFVLGTATFFLPCGFTQALQLYVLSKATFAVGALTMLAFSLGTLPALLSLSAMSSLTSGGLQRHFLRFAGAAVVVLGIANIQYGLVLSGSDASATSVAAPNVSATPVAAEPVEVEAAQAQVMNGKQVIVMRLDGFNYIPSQFIVKEGIPVEWRIDASEASGCGRILIAPDLGIRRILSGMSTTTIAFLPPYAGEFRFNCGMGMMTPGAKITVVPNDRG